MTGLEQRNRSHGSSQWWTGRAWLCQITLAVAVGVIYFLAARLSLALLRSPEGVAVFWPAAGIASGALIVLGPTVRLPISVGVVLATTMANLLGGQNLPASVSFGLCNAGEALLVAWLIHNRFGKDFRLESVRCLLGLFAAAVIAPAVSGIAATVAVLVFYAPGAPALITWFNWFASDAFGIILVAPLLIGLGNLQHDRPQRRELAEGTLTVGVLAIVSALAFGLPEQSWYTVLPLGVLLPVLLAAHCRPVFAAAATLIVGFTVVWSTTFGIGDLGEIANLRDRADAARATLLATSTCILLLAALFAERRHKELALQDSNDRLKLALVGAEFGMQVAKRLVSIVESSEDAIISKDLSGVIVSWNKGAECIFGYSAEEVIGASILVLIPPDRQHEELAILERIRRGERVKHFETVRRRKDGSLVDISITISPLHDAAGVIIGASKIARDISARKRTEEHQRALNAELDHRVKNVLATVCAIISQTRAASSTDGDFVVGLDRRIRSLANTHDLLSRAHWHGVALAEIVQREFTPYGRGNSEMRGPSVTLKAGAAQAVAMVLHELTTNAAKFGAFSNRNGRVLLKWCWQQNGGDPRLVIEWKEVGGPPVGEPSQSGYGTSVVRELIPFELGGTVDLMFGKDGLRCRLEIPDHWVSTGLSPGDAMPEVRTPLAAPSN